MLPLWAIIAPMVLQAIGMGVNTATSLQTSGAQIEAQKRNIDAQLAQQQALTDNQRIASQQEQSNMFNQLSQKHSQTINKGYSTGTTGNQMGAGLGVGVQGLNSTGYLNEDSVMAKVGGLFSKKGNTKSTVRDDNNLYFDRIEYAKCGGRFSRK